jgi:hypothetical protein
MMADLFDIVPARILSRRLKARKHLPLRRQFHSADNRTGRHLWDSQMS